MIQTLKCIMRVFNKFYPSIVRGKKFNFDHVRGSNKCKSRSGKWKRRRCWTEYYFFSFLENELKLIIKTMNPEKYL